MKIYKIIDNTNGNIYIGKTTKTLKRRLAQHKSEHTRALRYRCTSREIIKNGDYRIELIEETDDESRERYWILNTECINVSIPGRTHKEWYEDNKDKFKEYKKEHYENNKEKYQENKKRHYENNKKTILENNKQRYKYKLTWGGLYNDNNLLKIDPDLFIV